MPSIKPTDLRTFDVTLSGAIADVRAFLSAHPHEVRGVVRDAAGVTLRVSLEQPEIVDAARYRLRVRSRDETWKAGQRAQKQVGSGNRFAGRVIPPGLGVKVRP